MMNTPTPPMINDAGKNCPNCGATNDPVVSHCAFCQTPLPRVAIDALPEEVLLKNAALWVGRLESLKDSTAHDAAVSLDRNKKMGFGIGKLASVGTKGQFGVGDIVGYAEQYLIALEVRTRNDASLTAAANSLRERQRNAKHVLEYAQRDKGRRSRIIKWVVSVIGLLFLGGCLVFAVTSLKLATSEDYIERTRKTLDKLGSAEKQDAINDEIKKEKARLETVGVGLKAAILEKNFDKAELLFRAINIVPPTRHLVAREPLAPNILGRVLPNLPQGEQC
jgi:hypothetical protein